MTIAINMKMNVEFWVVLFQIHCAVNKQVNTFNRNKPTNYSNMAGIIFCMI